jgi:PAS domain S-box-containing protein
MNPDITPKPWRNRRVDAAIVIFNLTLIGILWYAVMAVIHIDRRDTINAAIDRNDTLAISLEQYAYRTIEGIDFVLKRVVREYAGNGHQFDATRLLADSPTGNQIIRGITLTDRLGNIVATLGTQPPAVPANIADRDHFKTLLAQGSDRIYVGKPVPDLVTGLLMVPVARRIVSPAGEFGGIATALVHHQRFTDLFEDARLDRLSTISLIGQDGITRARLRGTIASAGEDISKSPLFSEQARKPVGNYLASGQIDGVRRYFSYRSMPEHRLISTVGAAEDDVLSEFSARRRNYLLASALASALIAGFAVLLLWTLTAQRRTAAEKLRHQARFLATFNQAAVGIVHADLGGRFIEVNQKFCEMLGYTRAEMLDMTSLQITHPDDREASRQFRQQLLTGTGNPDSPQSEKRYIRKDGAVIWCLRTASIVRDEDGRFNYFASVILDITDRKTAEVVLRDYASRMRDLSRRLSEVEENERRNIHRELHDQIGANLSALKLDLGMIADMLPEQGRQQAGRRLHLAQQLVAETNARIRDIMGDLRPPALDDFGIYAALRSLAELCRERTSINVTVEGDDVEPRPPAVVETALFRIAQEALTNVSKHAQADRVGIRLEASVNEIRLTISDNGKGISATPGAQTTGWGLRTMRERAEAIDAAISITSAPGGGTCVTVTAQRSRS